LAGNVEVRARPGTPVDVLISAHLAYAGRKNRNLVSPDVAPYAASARPVTKQPYAIDAGTFLDADILKNKLAVEINGQAIVKRDDQEVMRTVIGHGYTDRILCRRKPVAGVVVKERLAVIAQTDIEIRQHRTSFKNDAQAQRTGFVLGVAADGVGDLARHHDIGVGPVAGQRNVKRPLAGEKSAVFLKNQAAAGGNETGVLQFGNGTLPTGVVVF